MTATVEERLGVGIDAIRKFCEKWGIVKFALFGSVVRDDFGPESDIDVMVRFDPERRPLGYKYVGVKLAFEAFLGRSVDMLSLGPLRTRIVVRPLNATFGPS